MAYSWASGRSQAGSVLSREEAEKTSNGARYNNSNVYDAKCTTAVTGYSEKHFRNTCSASPIADLAGGKLYRGDVCHSNVFRVKDVSIQVF